MDSVSDRLSVLSGNQHCTENHLCGGTSLTSSSQSRSTWPIGLPGGPAPPGCHWPLVLPAADSSPERCCRKDLTAVRTAERTGRRRGKGRALLLVVLLVVLVVAGCEVEAEEMVADKDLRLRASVRWLLVMAAPAANGSAFVSSMKLPEAVRGEASQVATRQQMSIRETASREAMSSNQCGCLSLLCKLVSFLLESEKFSHHDSDCN